jgi:hypothetical protein
MYWGQADFPSISTTTDQKGQKKVTSSGIEKPQLIFSGKFLTFFPITDIKHGFKFTTSLNISPVAKVPVR